MMEFFTQILVTVKWRQVIVSFYAARDICNVNAFHANSDVSLGVHLSFRR